MNKLYVLALVTVLHSTTAYALTDEEKARLEALRGFSLEELQELEVELDDVFDIFGALVRDEEVSIATGKKQSASSAPAVTSVITAQDIEAMGARTLEEALRGVPGMQIIHNPHSGYMPLYSARGLLSGIGPEMLVMIDGVPVKALNTGGTGRGWRGMPVVAIARIEVIRGPGSAVYGADAFSGVINVITKTATDVNGAEAGLRTASYDTYEAWLLYGKQHGELDLAASFNFIDSDGFAGILESDSQSFHDRRFGTQASNAPGQVQRDKEHYDLSLNIGYQGWHMRGMYQQRTMGQGTAGSLSPATERSEPMDGNHLLLSLDKQWQIGEDWQIQGRLSYDQRKFDYGVWTAFPPGAFGGLYPDGMKFRYELEQINSRAEVSAFYNGFRNHSLRLGMGYVHNNLKNFHWLSNFGMDATGNPIPPGSPMLDLSHTSASALPETARKNWFMLLQDTWNFAPNWSLNGGLRYDDYSDFGGTLNPRLALMHQFNERLTGKLLYGSAFRSPSLEEQYIKNTGTILGNPNVQPETIDTWELAFNYRATQDLYLNANVFNYRATDKILRLPQSINGNTVLVYQNAGKQTGYGFEVELRWKINSKSSLLANYSRVSTEDQDGEPTDRVPHQSAYLRADRMIGRNWFVDAQLNWVADRKRKSVDTRMPSEDYTTVDLSLRYNGMKDSPWNFAVGLRNVFDTAVREPSEYILPGSIGYFEYDYPVAEREWFAEIRYKF